jgi:integrase
MATIKYVVFAHHRREDGAINVKLRITQHRKVRYISTGVMVMPDELTRGLKIKSRLKTEILDRKVHDAYKKLEVVPFPDALDVDGVVAVLQRSQAEGGFLDFHEYVEKLAARKEALGQKGTAANYRTMSNRYMAFHPGRETLTYIDVNRLRAFEAWLRKDGVGDRGVSLYMGLIRATFNEAMREFNDESRGILPIPGSPFDRGRYRVPREPQPAKRSVDAKTIAAVATLPDTGISRIDQARDIFMLSFYLMGMNAADLYDCEIYRDGRIIYNRCKTRTRRSDQALMSVLVPREALPIMEHYRGRHRLFNFSERYSSVNNLNHAINIGLKAVAKAVGVQKLTLYAARHSWATIATNDCGVDKYTVHECLNHVDEAMAVTDRYIKKDWSRLDEANRKVLDYVRKCLPAV